MGAGRRAARRWRRGPRPGSGPRGGTRATRPGSRRPAVLGPSSGTATGAPRLADNRRCWRPDILGRSLRWAGEDSNLRPTNYEFSDVVGVDHRRLDVAVAPQSPSVRKRERLDGVLP